MSEEVGARVERVREVLARRGAGALVSVSPATQTYLCGFRALLYSRPIVLVVGNGATSLIVPGLEEAHARLEAQVDDLLVYHEHPEAEVRGSDRDLLELVLARLPAGQAIGIEAGGMPQGLAAWIEESGRDCVDVEGDLSLLRSRKDAAEIALISNAAKVLERGVEASVARCEIGVSELEIDGAGTAATLERASELGWATTVDHLVMTPSGPDRTTLPHAFSTTRRLRHGDGLIHTRQVGIDGYRAELERTLFVGDPSAEQRRICDAVRSAQANAIEAVRAGVRCDAVDAAARRVLDRAGLGRYAIHRTGHGIGLGAHEPPYLRFDNGEPLEEGAVITIEPGVYVAGVGGFRHSDTVLVTAGGCERLTSFPTDLRSLTIGSGG
jgi:Xaa-Pro dipeptidase